MQKIIILAISILTIVSCNRDDNSERDSIESSFDTFINSTVAVENNGVVELNYGNDKILDVFQKFSNKTKLGLQAESLSVETFNDKNYLRIYSKQNKVSTVALIKDENGQYRTGDTICTSSDCASGGGCLPEGSYCTKCYPEGTQSRGPITGDCTRTSSGGNQ